MFKVLGKAHYSVNYEGTVYNKIRYTLELLDSPKNVSKRDGILCDTVCITANEKNDLPQVGDFVDVYYNKYGKPAGLSIES